MWKKFGRQLLSTTTYTFHYSLSHVASTLSDWLSFPPHHIYSVTLMPHFLKLVHASSASLFPTRLTRLAPRMAPRRMCNWHLLLDDYANFRTSILISTMWVLRADPKRHAHLPQYDSYWHRCFVLTPSLRHDALCIVMQSSNPCRSVWYDVMALRCRWHIFWSEPRFPPRDVCLSMNEHMWAI